MALASPHDALVAAAGVGVSAASATLIQLWFRTQARRKHFRRRQTSSRVATFAEAFSSISWAGTAGLAAAGHWQAAITALIALGILFGARALAPEEGVGSPFDSALATMIALPKDRGRASWPIARISSSCRATASGRRSWRRRCTCCARSTGSFRSGSTFEEVPIGFAALKAHGTTLARCIVRGRQARRRRDPRPGVAQRLSAGRARRAQSVRRDCASGSTSTPTSARRRSRAGLPPRCGKPVDLVIVRENTEGFYADRNMFVGPGEFMPTPDSRWRCARSRAQGSTRIAETAFKLAMQRPQEGHRRAQGQRAARLRRAVSGMRARGRGEISAGRLRGADHRRHGGAAGARRQPRST